MNNLAIPVATPAVATANPLASTAPVANEARFGDTLRKTQAKPETQARSHAPDKSDSPKHTDAKPETEGKYAKQNDARTEPPRNDHPAEAAPAAPPAAPVAAPIVPLASTNGRQVSAEAGKTLPPAGAPVATLKGEAVTNAAAMMPLAATPPTHPATTGVTLPPDVAANPNPDASMDADAAEPSLFARMSLRDALAPAAANGDKPAMASHLASNDFSAHLGQLLGAHAAQTAAPAPATAPVQIAMQATPDQPQPFAQETAQHVAWLAGKGIDKAEIQLNPRKLGPIHVEISTHNDRVDVSFAVQHPQTVHALQQTLPQLHDMLAQQGLNLGQASVGQQSPGQQHTAFAQHLGGGANGDAGNGDSDVLSVPRTLRIATPGRVDDFA